MECFTVIIEKVENSRCNSNTNGLPLSVDF